VSEHSPVTYLFSDIEGSTRLWEADPDGAARALAWHDRISREIVSRHRGTVVKMTGDGLHAAFAESDAALAAVIDLQMALAQGDAGLPALKVRCGLHAGADQRRDNDYYGPAVNRAARIMNAAHGGQILLSQAVAERVAGTLPEGVALRELGQVRLKDLSVPERVYQVLHPALRPEFPALRSLASTPNNLPQQLDSFIDREQEMSEVRELLRRHRLVTLLAMGGIGKSRLSIQLGAEVLDDFPDGVWLIELAPISDVANVAQATAAVLGVKEEAGGGVVEALERFVRDRSLLLIMDNCEHVVRGAADLAKRLLQAGAAVKILASSRDPLQIAGETVFHVPTLPVPDAHHVQPEQLAQHASVELFLDRARAAQPSFRLTEQLAAPIAEICRRLDGIPLALELAAARTRTLPVDAIAARLDQRFRLLTTRDQTVLPRQRTLRALIDWSHDLLNERERAAFRRLAVFAGGWTLEAAEAVVADDDIVTDEVLDLLASLVEKSLVAMQADSGRYRMLDTVRHYALDRLQESGDGPLARARHLAWCLAFAEKVRPGLAGPNQGRWLGELDRERENMLTAHRWCDEAENGIEQGLQLVFLLKLYWYQRGLMSLGYRVTLEALSRTLDNGRSVLRCRGLADVGQFCSYMGRYAEARGYLEESLAIARELGDVKRIAAVLQPLGLACMSEGSTDRARECLAEAVEVARKVDNPRQLASALSCRAQLLRQQKELAEADRLSAEAIDIAQRLGDQESVAIGLLNRAMVAIEQGSARTALPALKQALQIGVDTGSHFVSQAALDVMAGAAAALGDAPAAARFFGATEAEAERSGLRRDSADAAFLLPLMLRARSTLGDQQYESARAGGAQWGHDEAVRRALAQMAELERTPVGVTPC
jgi:predicted ATPase/class 3 adenylate cyclase